MYYNYEVKWKSLGGSGTYRCRARSEFEAIDMCRGVIEPTYGSITILSVKIC